MAFWGAPEQRLDHGRAACNGALMVAREVEAFNAERRKLGLHACRMRIGLHTGTVLVGNIGFAGRVDYTAIGEAVNVAFRLEQFGRNVPAPDEVRIVVSASCRAGRAEPDLTGCRSMAATVGVATRRCPAPFPAERSRNGSISRCC